MKKIILMFACFVSGISVGLAASFDCNKAKTDVEKIVCGDARLSQLDEDLSSVYKPLLKRKDIRQEIVSDQRIWLSNVLDRCKDVACLTNTYERRIKYLKAMGLSNPILLVEEGSNRQRLDLEAVSRSLDGVKAILAMYAMQLRAGCDEDESNNRCSLTDTLQLGERCSGKHLNLVYAWFKKGVPPFGVPGEGGYQTTDDPKVLENICRGTSGEYAYDDYRFWGSLRLAVVGKRVNVIAEAASVSRDKFATHSFRDAVYFTEYEIDGNSITIISHQKVK